MLSRANRFHGYNSLRRVYQGGQTVRGPLFAVRSRLNEGRKSYRLAVVVSRKVSKSAVTRNRIRRRLYETSRSMEDDLGKPYDIVITVFHERVKDEPPRQLRAQLEKQFRQAGIIE